MGRFWAHLNMTVPANFWGPFGAHSWAGSAGAFCISLQLVSRSGGQCRCSGPSPHQIEMGLGKKGQNQWARQTSESSAVSGSQGQCIVCALMGCLRSGARCVSVGRVNFAFWPAAWGCSVSSDLTQVSTFFYCRHSIKSGVLASLSLCAANGSKSQHFYCRH